MKKKNPFQPIIRDLNGTIRFRENKIVSYLLDKGGIDLNQLAAKREDFTQDDWVQFAQLIGYSLKGFHELSYVPDNAALQATTLAQSQGWPEAMGCRDAGCSVHSGVRDRR